MTSCLHWLQWSLFWVLPPMSGYLQQCSPQWQLSAQLNLLPAVMQPQQWQKLTINISVFSVIPLDDLPELQVGYGFGLVDKENIPKPAYLKVRRIGAILILSWWISGHQADHQRQQAPVHRPRRGQAAHQGGVRGLHQPGECRAATPSSWGDCNNHITMPLLQV